MVWDYLIVGQGLAGSVLSYQLIKNDLKVLVFDDPDFNKSSTVAAGIFNPFTGRKLVKTWMADQLFTYLLEFYKIMESELAVQLLYEIPMFRPFLSVQEQNQWSGRLFQMEYQPYIDRLLNPTNRLSQVINPLGGMMLKKSGYVDIVALMKGMTDYLEKRDCYRPESFTYSDLKVSKNEVQYKEHIAGKIVFCEGPFVDKNPFFNWLPLKPVKGEILDIELKEPLEYIANRGVFVLPVTHYHCKVGSTFDNQDLSVEITVKAKSELLGKLDKLLKVPYRVTGHYAGIRPATLDRRPFVGLHPEYEPIAIFNGLGTKGVSLAPYFAQEFFEFLEGKKPLNRDVTINRYFSLYYSKI